MSALDQALYKTRKTILEVLSEIGDNNICSGDTNLEQCSSCDIWLYPKQLKKDLDGSPICKECETFYGL